MFKLVALIYPRYLDLLGLPNALDFFQISCLPVSSMKLYHIV